MPHASNAIASRAGPRITLGGTTLVTFASCDYLSLATHPAVVEALTRAAAEIGLSASAARSTTGAFDAHAELEHRLAAFLRTEDAVLLPAGSLAAQALADGLAHRATHWLADEHAHPCTASALLARHHARTFAHNNPADLARRLAELPSDASPAVITDAVAAPNGAQAPAADLLETLPPAGHLCLDESHALGVIGPTGRGLRETLSADPRVVAIGSLAKAVGCFGGYVAGPASLCDRIRAHSPTQSATTPLPPPIAAAAAAAIALIDADPEPLRRLRRNAVAMNAILADIGLPARRDLVPIFTLPADTLDPRAAEAAFRDAGLLVPAFDYPGLAAPILRWTVQAAHTDEHLDRFAAALRRLLRNRP